jgi:hypothetical protein
VILLALIITTSGFQSNESLVLPDRLSVENKQIKEDSNNPSRNLNRNPIEPIDNVINIPITGKGTQNPLNPFKKNILKKKPLDKITILINGVIELQNPADNCIIINDTALCINDSIAGLLITEIYSEYIMLKSDNNTFRIPIQDSSVSLNIENLNKI